MSDAAPDPSDPGNRDDAAGSSLPSEFEAALPSSSDDEIEHAGAAAPPPLPADASDQPAATEISTAISKEEKIWAAALHGTGAAGLLCHFTSVPFLNIIVPLVIWLVKKDEMPFVHRQGKEVLNFQLSWTLYGLAAGLVFGIIGFILTFVIIGIFILWAVAIFGGLYVIVMAVMSIIGTVSAADGKEYKYPATIRFLK